MGKFNEALHPRGRGGKFTGKGGVGGGGRSARKATKANERAQTKQAKANRKEFKRTHKRVLTDQGKRVRTGAIIGGVPGAVIANKTGKNKGQALTKTVKRSNPKPAKAKKKQ